MISSYESPVIWRGWGEERDGNLGRGNLGNRKCVEGRGGEGGRREEEVKW